MRFENSWHEIRDHSFIQNHSRSSDSQLLLFSSLIFYRVQVREHLTRDQRPFLHPESLQIFRFTASSLQFTHSSSTGFRSENTWHEIRDHSFIQNHSRSSDSQLLLFSSSHSSSTGFRSENTWHEIRDHSFIQNHSRSFRFTASSLQFTHSSSTGFRLENTWHEIRDHSFIQNHSRSSDSQLLLFSSLIFYRVQVREHLTRDQRPFLHPESLQIFRFTASSLQFTSLIFYRVQIREHLTRDQRPFLHPESLQIFRFTASSLQFTHSSSTGFRSENTWHEIRDHSFIQNHSRSSDSQLLLFSSLTHLLQGSDQRTPDTRSETIPSSRITPDLQIHSFSSSVHLTHLLQGSDQRTPDTRSETIPSSRITPDPSDSQLLLFSSLTHLLQGSDQRTPDTRSETIPSSRITPDLQIHSFFSSVHSLIFCRVQIREHLTRDQRPFLHPESLQIFRFTASSLQFTHSSSAGFRSENTWHETRDHSFIQNHSRSSDSQLLLFSSPHSSSTGFRSENTWHEIRDHSFIQNHSRSSDSQLLLFSSLTHLLQGSDQRTPDTRSETIPSSRITPDLQIHSFSSSVHSLIFYRVQIRKHLTRDQRPFLHPESLQIFRFTASPLQFTSLIFYRVQIREHLTRDQRPFLHPESLQIFRFTASPLQFTHSSSTGFRSENTWHEIRDHSFIQNHSRSSDSQLLLFSSPHSSSTGFRSENTWHEIRDHSFIQNHSRSSDSQLLLFSSLTHLLQGLDQRTPDTRSETIPSSRITPDLQIHSFFSSVHSSSTGFRSENTWHEIRDHSFIQNHSRSSDSQLLLFSSLTHLLQGSGQRTPDTRSETIPSSRITPDLQIHSFFSSVHSLIFCRVQIREHLTRDQRPFLHPESLQIFRFTASSLQFTHSSSTGFRSENTWHEIRDHSFIQNHSRSSDSQLFLFSSLIFYRVQIREHLIRDQRPFLHPESLQIFRFTASSLQFTHSSSTGFRSENTWHEIRDHSFIQNHSRPSDSQLLLFSSLTHLLQGSGQRTPDTRSETIPSSRITPDLQIHSFFSSVHLTHLLQGSGQRTPDPRSETIPSSRITPDLQIHSFFSSVHLTHLLQGSGQRTPDTRSETIPSSRITPDPSDSQLLLFSSLTHLLQGSGQRTPDTRSETIPSSRITPDLQIRSFFSSVHSLIFYRVQVREHLTRDQRPFLHPESLQIFRFTASSLQFTHSSSTGFRSENTWHEIRDHSFIQNHSRSSDSQLLLFSSLTHLLQGSGQRTPDPRSETIPSSRITPDLQIRSFFSSVHSSSTGFRSENTWPEIRDHSFIQNHSRSSDSQLLLFSSLTHLLQGSGQRTPDTRSETIPSSRITPDLQIHSFFSSVHLTHLLQGSGQRTPDTRSETIPSSRITPDLQIHSFFSSVHSLIFYRVQVREHLARDQRPFLHPESLQIFRFTASSLQFTHSSSTGFRSENTWHEIRDHSFIQNHSRSSDSQLLLFSSPHSSSTGFRSENTWHEIRDHSFIQNHSRSFRFTASPLQFTHSSSTGFRSENTWHEIRDHSFIQNHSRSFRFTASPLQFTHSSSTGFRSENTWHEIRDHSFIQNHSRSSDSQLLLFSSLTHLLQGSDQRTPDTRSETIPSSRITPDLQIHSFSSSVHSTHLLQGSGQRNEWS